MHEAGCVYVTDADRPIVDSLVMRRLLAYAGGQACWSPTGRPTPG
jgi:dihydroorotase